MWTILRAALTCTLMVTFGLSAPAAAAPGEPPSADRMRKALLTVDDLPDGMTAGETGTGRGDNDFSAWNRCKGPQPPAGNDVEYVHAAFSAGGPEAASVQTMIGATGSETGRAVVASRADELQRCPAGMTRWPLPRLGDASVTVVLGSASAKDLFGSGEDRTKGVRAAVIAQGDVLAYIVGSELGEAEFTRILQAGARRLARHFPASGDRMAVFGGERSEAGLAEPVHQ
ncbi:hypothetical protein QLQ12_02105 [Actinoplanes sp. NEAU-A12]|uniref:Secreted protein n=1 Tax=Actinoplanes sandaracinus TaxID=3045177 RepID=A0ABT6WCD9_9ACTN|nr:hypothetical protein [Actinoplanes sandaracinus]MDI6097394.1 hypothetical protein [Actinoplanes sandaracinus]